MFVSMETVKKDLTAVRKRLNEFDLHVAASGCAVTIEGNELDKRKMLSDVLYEEFSENIFSLSAVEKVFPQYDVQYVCHAILPACRERRFLSMNIPCLRCCWILS
jgi:lichenan operon transcriptional antiterminator